ncbi:MAG: hypothetical protein IPL08_02100 [Saprospiraceae bacterium]|nr:hypothetical protein [Saprospiraceae bacterium]
MKWLSIRDVKMLIKKGLYTLETGAAENLIYDNITKKYVGHIDSEGNLNQNQDYQIPIQIQGYLNELDGNANWNEKNPW